MFGVGGGAGPTLRFGPLKLDLSLGVFGLRALDSPKPDGGAGYWMLQPELAVAYSGKEGSIGIFGAFQVFNPLDGKGERSSAGLAGLRFGWGVPPFPYFFFL